MGKEMVGQERSNKRRDPRQRSGLVGSRACIVLCLLLGEGVEEALVDKDDVVYTIRSAAESAESASSSLTSSQEDRM